MYAAISKEILGGLKEYLEKFTMKTLQGIFGKVPGGVLAGTTEAVLVFLDILLQQPQENFRNNSAEKFSNTSLQEFMNKSLEKLT